MNSLNHINPKKIGIFRALQLGDLLCAIPAIESIKKAFPSADLILIGLPWAKEFSERYSAIFSGFIEFPGYPGLPEKEFNTLEILKFIEKVQEEKFDLIFQMHGNGSIINPLMQLFNARFTAGFYSNGSYCPDKNYYSIYPDNLPEIMRHINFLQFLGIPVTNTELYIPETENDKNELKYLFEEYNLKQDKYICVHAGARDAKKYWKPNNFALIADKLIDKGFKVVLTGTKAETETIEAVKGKMNNTPIDFAGKTSFGALALLIRKSRMLLSNDTGVSHIAAATKTPSIVIFLASDPQRWAPLNRDLHKIILPDQATDIDYVMQCTEELLFNYDLVKREMEMN